MNKYYDDVFKFDLNTKIKEVKEINGQYHYIFEETNFYVESGGMPSDQGIINGYPVQRVYKENQEVVHVLNDRLSDPIEIKIDRHYRILKSQTHSAQHLICTLINKRWNAKTIMFKTGDKFSEIEMGFSTLDWSILNDIEELCNQYIQEDLPIIIGYPTKEEALANIEEDYGDFDFDMELRSVSIPKVDYDLCACIHMPSLRYLQTIKFLGFEKTTRGYKIKFVAGNQLREYFQSKQLILQQVANELATNDEEILHSIHKLQEEKKELNSQLLEYKKKYIDYLCRELDQENKYLYHDFFDLDLKTFQLLCSTFSQKYAHGYIFVCHLQDRCHVVCARNKEIDFDCRTIFKELATNHNLRGGGSPFIAQGGGEFTTELSESAKKIIDSYQEKK